MLFHACQETFPPPVSSRNFGPRKSFHATSGRHGAKYATLFCMASEIESLQERVDVICATGDSELVTLAYHALSRMLFEFTRRKTGRNGAAVPIIRRVNLTDVQFLLADL